MLLSIRDVACFLGLGQSLDCVHRLPLAAGWGAKTCAVLPLFEIRNGLRHVSLGVNRPAVWHHLPTVDFANFLTVPNRTKDDRAA
jgi:hypothetical protein